MTSYTLNFYTTYHQFYLTDKHSPFRTDSDDFWTKDASEDKLAIEEGVIGVGTECYGPVKGELYLLDSKSIIEDFGVYDHVVEGSIDVKSGILQIFPCPFNESVLEIKLDPGTYRVRVYSTGLETVEFDEGDDFYKIEIWRQEYTARKVLKK